VRCTSRVAQAGRRSKSVVGATVTVLEFANCLQPDAHFRSKDKAGIPFGGRGHFFSAITVPSH
jgi:hypothetical protein